MSSLNVIVDPSTVKEAAVQIQDELAKMDCALSSQLKHSLGYLMAQSGGRRTRTRTQRRHPAYRKTHRRR